MTFQLVCIGTLNPSVLCACMRSARLPSQLPISVGTPAFGRVVALDRARGGLCHCAHVRSFSRIIDSVVSTLFNTKLLEEVTYIEKFFLEACHIIGVIHVVSFAEAANINRMEKRTVAIAKPSSYSGPGATPNSIAYFASVSEVCQASRTCSQISAALEKLLHIDIHIISANSAFS